MLGANKADVALWRGGTTFYLLELIRSKRERERQRQREREIEEERGKERDRVRE